MSRPRRILLTSLSGQFGGMELRMIAEAQALKALGHHVAVAAPAFDGSAALIAGLREQGGAFTPFQPQPIFTDWRRRHLALLKAELWQRRRLARLRPDLVHVFFSWTDQGLDNLWLAGRSSIATVASVHNHFPIPDFPAWHRRHLGTAFGSLRGLYGVSRSARDRFVEIYDPYIPADALRSVLYNFVDTERFRPSAAARQAARQRLGLNPGLNPGLNLGLGPGGESDILIGAVGRFDDQKKPLDVLATFARVRQRLPGARLLMVGEGPLEAALRARIAELGCEEAVTLMGFQPDIETLYPALDLHLLLRRNEGFGSVTAEAMACGVLAVGSRVPGTDEVIGDCPAGRLVAAGDSGQAAEAVVELLSQSADQRAALGEAGRRHIVARFGKPAWQQGIAQFYGAVLDRKEAV
ncbi:MAG: glycosyltransferase family 4 protein [Kiloniellaceae bacterium]